MFAMLCTFVVLLSMMFLPWQGDLGVLHQWTLTNPWYAAVVVYVNVLILFVWGWKRWGDRMAALDRATGQPANG